MSMEVILSYRLIVDTISAKVIVGFSVFSDTVSLLLESLSHHLLRLLSLIHVLVVVVGGSVVAGGLFKSHLEVCNPHILHFIRS